MRRVWSRWTSRCTSWNGPRSRYRRRCGVSGSRPLCRSEETDEGLGGVCGKDGTGPSWWAESSVLPRASSSSWWKDQRLLHEVQDFGIWAEERRHRVAERRVGLVPQGSDGFGLHPTPTSWDGPSRSRGVRDGGDRSFEVVSWPTFRRSPSEDAWWWLSFAEPVSFQSRWQCEDIDPFKWKLSGLDL